jgi:predicted nucleic acid-binding protein
MRIIVSDTSCIIDLGKGGLLGAVLALPYTFVMPDVLFADELIDFGPVAKPELLALGFRVIGLDGEGTRRASEYFARYRRLSLHDCFALTLAVQTAGCILLTGDRTLRQIATAMGIEVHGVLWVLDQLEYTRLASVQQLYDALCHWEQDALVFLPRDELRRRIRRLRHLL